MLDGCRHGEFDQRRRIIIDPARLERATKATAPPICCNAGSGPVEWCVPLVEFLYGCTSLCMNLLGGSPFPRRLLSLAGRGRRSRQEKTEPGEDNGRSAELHRRVLDAPSCGRPADALTGWPVPRFCGRVGTTQKQVGAESLIRRDGIAEGRFGSLGWHFAASIPWLGRIP